MMNDDVHPFGRSVDRQTGRILLSLSVRLYGMSAPFIFEFDIFFILPPPPPSFVLDTSNSNNVYCFGSNPRRVARRRDLVSRTLPHPKQKREIMSGSTPSPTGSSGASAAGAKSLQERLHQLLTRLSSTIELIKNWPESDGDDASIHVETTSKLISQVWEVIVALQRVEGVVKADAALRKSLQDCPVPINLLDLLDHGNGLNPGAYSKSKLNVISIIQMTCLLTWSSDTKQIVFLGVF
jgi:hypothetical protein